MFEWKVKHWVTLIIIYTIEVLAENNTVKKPHIIFILADDLGWNDVGYHGSAQIPTPNIDALAYSGIILNRYYVNPICTPSRSALMTGKYPIHTGMQHTVLYAAEPRGLPLTEKILPEYLNEIGYSSHIAGKWHLGHYKLKYTPLYRGFKSHLGFWSGRHDYFDHTSIENKMWGLDIRNGTNVAFNLHGQYTTDIVTKEACSVIKNHDPKNPLFLYVAHAATHSGNPYNPLPAPDEVIKKMSNIKDYNRRRFAAMVSKLDDSVGEIVKELSAKKLLNDSIIIFSTDNGGPANGFNLNHASNWPLRGVKNTLWEGGVRGAGLIWSPMLKKQNRVGNQIMHISDWLPTLLAAAGYEKQLPENLDGISVWNELSNDEVSRRIDILHNIDDIWNSSSLTSGDWKILKGTNYQGTWDGWYGPAGDRSESQYLINSIYNSFSGKALLELGKMPTVPELIKLRTDSSVDCFKSDAGTMISKLPKCEPLKSPCLFNINDDPCEQYNLAEKHPSVLQLLLEKLDQYNSTSIRPSNKPLDPRADPKKWNYIWTNFGDFVEY